MSAFGLVANLAATGYGLWQKNQANKDAADAYRRRNQIAKALAAEQLAITYNSILRKSMETAAMFKRKELELKVKTRQAEGAAITQAAHAGATGKRVNLARNMAIRGGSERMMTDLEVDSKRAQDALIERADMEERATVNRLISGTPDIPINTNAIDVGNALFDSIDAIGEYQAQKTQLDNDIVSGAFNNRPE